MAEYQPNIPKCGAKSRQTGNPCKRAAGWGTPHLGYGTCRIHGGMTGAQIKHAARLQAAELPIVMGLPEETDPNTAVMRALWSINGAVSYCDHRVALASTVDEVGRDTPSDAMRYWLQVRTHAVNELSRVAKMASDMGVSQRQIELAERMGGLLADLIGGVLGELNLSAQQQEIAPAVVRRHLELVAGQAV